MTPKGMPEGEVEHSTSDARNGYALFLLCQEIDGFGHNAVFTDEIRAGLAQLGQASEAVDYRQEPRRVHSALLDPNCAFAICYNGFGSELSQANSAPGQLVSAFRHFRKPLVDLMHDCPAHETMAHQVSMRDPNRRLLLTDYGYVQEADELGFPHVRYVPSITFPRTLPTSLAERGDRQIKVLLPVQLPPPSAVDQRFVRGASYRHRVFREIYEAVSEVCVADLRADPRVETRRACRGAGFAFDPMDPHHRFLLTVVLDRVKFQRRRDLVWALAGLPVTLITSLVDSAELPPGLSTAPARSFRELLAIMAEAECVICPLPHFTGHHERALGAFSAGAAVISAPNAVLETEFQLGQEFEMYRSSAELAASLPLLLQDHERRRYIASAGRGKAIQRFSPKRLAHVILNAANRMID